MVSAAVDISDPVVLSRFMQICRFWIITLAIFSSIITIAAGYWGYGWLVGFVAAIVAYTIVHNPRRAPLLVWIWFLILAAIVFGVGCLWWLIQILSSEFTVGIILPFGVMIFGMYSFWRFVHKRSLINEQHVAARVQFAVEPSFIETWLSGGWKFWILWGVLLVGSFMVAIPTDTQIGAFILFVLAASTGTLVVWVLFPVTKAVRDGFALHIVRAIKRNRAKCANRSYYLFLLGGIIRNPKALKWLFLFAPMFVVFIILVSTLFDWLGMSPTSGSYYVSAGILTALTTCWTRASQYALQGAVKTTDPGSEPFILFLRSFMDEEVALRRDSLFLRLFAFGYGSVWSDSPEKNPFLIRFEELVAGVVWPFGKMLAIGCPGEALPRVGAIRLQTDPAMDWQTKVDHLISLARYVVVSVGISSGIKWEFQQLEGSQDRTKLSLMSFQGQGSMLDTWRIFAERHAKLVAYPEAQLKRSLAMRFDRDGSPIMIFAEKKSAAAYRTALNTCFLPLEEFLELARTRIVTANVIEARV